MITLRTNDPSAFATGFLLAGAIVLTCVCGGCVDDTSSIPQAKAVVDNEQIDFGNVTLGTTVTHVYTIHNRGKTVLKLAEPQRAPGGGEYEVDCQLSARNIPPGGKATAKLKIRPLERTQRLFAGVTIGSNAGELRIGGRLTVENVFEIVPAGTWILETRKDGELAESVGILHSVGAKPFRVTVEADSPVIHVDTVELTKRQLLDLKAKSGYRITVRVKDLNDVGRFSSLLKFKTDLDAELTKSVTVGGVRWGPVIVLAANPKQAWNSRLALVDMGEFPAKEGKTVSMLLTIASPESGQQVQCTRTETSSSLIELSVEADTKRSTQARQWFRLTVAVPPGRPYKIHDAKNPIIISVVTNHPRAEVIRLQVQMVSH